MISKLITYILTISMHSPDTMNLWNQLTAYVIGRLTYSEAALHS